MEYRRAIESYCDQRQLFRELADYPDPRRSRWHASASASRKTFNKPADQRIVRRG